MSLLISLLSFLLLPIPSLSKGQAIEQGCVIEKVVCQYDRTQSYALYLPSGYTPEKQWPIIYTFDPGARGEIPVTLFKDAAEKYGYILAGSNNSQNGPWENNVKAANAIWVDSHLRFHIDDERVYATGFSGGARMASGLSDLLKKPLAGIIACGAGPPKWLTLDKIAPAAFFGIAGLADMNYKEIKHIDKELDSLNTAHRIRIFDGLHDWPPKELCKEAVEWMELQALKAGKKGKDEVSLEYLFKQGINKATRFVNSGNTYEALQIYEALGEDFSGLVDVAEAEAKAAQIKSDPAFKIKQEQERQSFEEELRLIKDIRENFWKLKEKIEDPIAREKLIRNFQLDRLLEESKNTQNSFRSMMAKRLLQDFSYNIYEQGEIALKAQDYSTAAVFFELVVISSFGHAEALYKLASVYSLNKEKEKALQALKQAVERGFSNRDQIEKDKSFDPIREKNEFKALLELLKKKK